MKNTILNRLDICVLLGLTAYFYTPHAQAEGETELLQLELIPNKIEFKLGEPITFQFKLINFTDEPISIHGLFHFSYGGFARLAYKHQNDRRFRSYSRVLISNDDPFKEYMVPVEGTTFTAFLAFDSMKHQGKHALFDKAGNYIFKYSASFYKVSLEKSIQVEDEINVSVTQPTGVDVLAFERWMDEDVLWTVQGHEGNFGVGDANKGVEKLRALIAEYPNSTYGQYAQRELTRRGIKMEGEPELESIRKSLETQKEDESEQKEENFRVKIGPGEFPVIFEDGNYENLDKVSLIWTVNNLFEHTPAFKIVPISAPLTFCVNGRKIEANFYLKEVERYRFSPGIRAAYHGLIEEDGVHHLVLSREFIDAYIEASKYEEVKDELNDLIDRINRINSTELNNLTETQINSMLFIDPRFEDEFDLEKKRELLRKFSVDRYFLPTNVFWIVEDSKLGRYIYDREPAFVGKAICYIREDYWKSKRPNRSIVPYDPPPSNFDPHLHTEPGAEPFVWVPDKTLSNNYYYFIYHKRQWKALKLRYGYVRSTFYVPDLCPPDVEAESENEPQAEEEEDFRVKVGASEFPVILEDGDYENLNKAGLIWTVNNLYEHISDFEFVPVKSYTFQSLDGREMESNLYLRQLSFVYGPDIERVGRSGYNRIIEEDGVHHLRLSWKFIEAYIKASRYEKVKDELNDFIDRFNRLKSAEIDNLTEAEIDSLFYSDPKLEDKHALEKKREFIVSMHFQPTNVFWIEEKTESNIYSFGDGAKSMYYGGAIFYTTKEILSSLGSGENINYNLHPPSNFDPRLHTVPDAEPIIWVPAGKLYFIYLNRKWKTFLF